MKRQVSQCAIKLASKIRAATQKYVVGLSCLMWANKQNHNMKTREKERNTGSCTGLGNVPRPLPNSCPSLNLRNWPYLEIADVISEEEVIVE